MVGGSAVTLVQTATATTASATEDVKCDTPAHLIQLQRISKGLTDLKDTGCGYGLESLQEDFKQTILASK